MNKKFLLTLLLAASPVLFIAAGCGTWNKGTGPAAALTPTNTTTQTTSNTPTNSPTKTPTGTPTNTPSATPTPTSAAACANPAAVSLGTAANYVILAETGITNVPTSAVTGNIGNYPGSGTQIIITCAQVNGIIYSADAAGPNSGCETVAPVALNTAINDMGTAYTNTNGLPNCVTELGAGTVTGQTLTRGKYYWSTNVNIPTNLHLDALGDSTARWDFQIAGTLYLASAVTIYLDNGALPQNVVWTVAGATATLDTTSQFAGVLMAGPSCLIALNTGASVHGRLLSQTQVTLQKNVVTFP